MEAGERLRGFGGRGERVAEMIAPPRHPRLDHRDQPCLATEQMRDAGHVDRHATGRIERDDRAEAIAGVADRLQPLGIGARIGLEHREFGHARAGVGQRQARHDAERDRLGRAGDQPHRTALALGQHQRALVSRRGEARRAGPRHPIDRQIGEPERQVAPGFR